MGSSRPSSSLGRRALRVVLAAAVVVSGALPAPSWAAEPAATEALRAAVMPFRTPPEDAELAPMGAALADMLATDLAVAPDLRLV